MCVRALEHSDWTTYVSSSPSARRPSETRRMVRGRPTLCGKQGRYHYVTGLWLPDRVVLGQLGRSWSYLPVKETVSYLNVDYLGEWKMCVTIDPLVPFSVAKNSIELMTRLSLLRSPSNLHQLYINYHLFWIISLSVFSATNPAPSLSQSISSSVLALVSSIHDVISISVSLQRQVQYRLVCLLYCTVLLCYTWSFNFLTGFVGLVNQAMTCYLNSFLQTLYMTPEFRNAIYRYICTSVSYCACRETNYD